MNERLLNGPFNNNQSLFTYTVDSYSNGIALGQHKLEKGEDPRLVYRLRMGGEEELVKLRSRYAFHKCNPLWELERYLMKLSRRGTLSSAVIYFGVTSDPFFPFAGKFDASIRFLQLFERYTPGLLVVQTRSPLVVITMPVLRKLGEHAVVTIGVETPLEEEAQRYTPGLPKVEERLRAACALRRFGVEVTLQVHPLLPYGDWKLDAFAFAKILVEHADYLHVHPISDGLAETEKKIRRTPLAKKLAQDRRYQWLRPDTANPLLGAIEGLAPQKLLVPQRKHLAARQMNIFAA